MKHHTPRTIGQIKSLEDLRLEKTRLQMDILKKENQIQSDYHQMLNRLTFRHVFLRLKEDIALTTNVASKVISIGKKVFGKKKKKKLGHGGKNITSLPPESITLPEEITGE